MVIFIITQESPAHSSVCLRNPSGPQLWSSWETMSWKHRERRGKTNKLWVSLHNMTNKRLRYFIWASVWFSYKKHYTACIFQVTIHQICLWYGIAIIKKRKKKKTTRFIHECINIPCKKKSVKFTVKKIYIAVVAEILPKK